MRVAASVDESDVSRVQPGQPVTVTVDAYPGERFRGTVAQVRLQATVVSNVTTYSAIVDLPNADLKLKPGMTANVEIETARRQDVLRVPAAALRFRPTAEMFAALHQPDPSAASDVVRVRAERGVGAADAVRTPPTATSSRAQLWVMKDGALHSLAVRSGLSDGTLTELVDAPLEAGATVVTTVLIPSAAKTTAPATSMFTSQGGGRGRGL